jgi:transposase
MERKRKLYSREFKQEAVRLASQSSLSLAALARDLGVDANSLRNWKREQEQHGQQAFPGKGRSHDEELARLRREVALLRQERDILKKAGALWAGATLPVPHAEIPVYLGASQALAGERAVPGATPSSERLLSLAFGPGARQPT